MNRTANIIVGYADQIRKRAGNHLYFEFQERSYWTHCFHRERCVSMDFDLSPKTRQRLLRWISNRDWPNPDHFRIVEGKTDVVVSWRRSVASNSRVFCTMPPIAYDLEDNPIYKALRKKARQVRGAKPGVLRCVFLFDAGCHLLHRLRSSSGLWGVGGDEIIRHALKKLGLDIVCVFSPHRKNMINIAFNSCIQWQVTCFDTRTGITEKEFDLLRQVANCLPIPRYEAYQARDLHRHGTFNPMELEPILGTSVTTTPRVEKMSIRISSRLVQEYFAGRITLQDFSRHAFGDDNNYFESELVRGNTIQSVKFERGGIDEDDDHLVFDLDFDWSVSNLKTQRVGEEGLWSRIWSETRRAYARGRRLIRR